jgi:[CysO sulfur-carrier protein]-thiocarboxylate-dependent cysteine synthase
VKDRVARAMLAEARARGALAHGQTIIEPSSGNTGISLAMIGSRFGHPVRIVMPDNTTPERVALLRAAGAHIVFSPGSEGSNGAIRLAESLAASDPSLFMPYQYGNPANPHAHEETTGPEILAQVPELDVFVAGLGTGGTLTGVGRFLHRARPAARVVAAEPLPGELVQGLRSLDDGFVPPILDLSVIDDKRLVANREAVIGLRRLMREEGILAGLSSGAAIHVALRVAEEATRDVTIVVLLADGGWKYLSTGLWTRDLDELSDELEGSLLW